MFTGSINTDARSIVYEMSEQWQDKKVFVGCSGNFTVERILNERGITNIYSNDVSMYSCAIGNYISGKPVGIEVKDPAFGWLPIASVLGNENLPAQTVVKMNRAMELMLGDGDVKKESKWGMMDVLLDQYLSEREGTK